MQVSFAVNRHLVDGAIKWKVALLGVFILLSATSPAHSATTVGATPGSHQVSPSGAFTYSIPIAVPPGVAGIEPKLSLAYNSQGGNGLLGMGWSLSGLSVIHRCPKTYSQDGQMGGVNYNANDRYCLDGQRLVAISGAYGANATEYRTESESYSRIVSYGSQGSGPASWKVWTKSGQIIEYGNTADSRIEAQGKTEVMLWALNKLSDTVNNYLTVSYSEDNPNGQYHPDRIDYTGNANAGKSPQNSVRFVYETRPDITPAYHAGLLSRVTVRLTNVQSYAGDIVSRDYRLAYELSPASKRTRIANITECVDGDCLSPTVLDWKNSPGPLFAQDDGFNINGLQLSNSNKTTGIYLGDFDGDGKADILRWGDDSANNTLFLSNGDGSFSQPASFNLKNTNLQHSSFSYGTVLGDFNGDGKTDILRWANAYANNALYLSNGDGSFTQSAQFNIKNTYLSSQNRGVGVLVGDFNGDGRADIIRWWDTYSNNLLYLSNGDGSFTQSTAFNIKDTYLGHSNQSVGGYIEDFNGDGRADILRWWGAYWLNEMYISNGDGSFSKSTAFNIRDTYLNHSNRTVGSLLGDFNGDGRVDILRWWMLYQNNLLYFSNGNGSFTNAATFNIKNRHLGYDSGRVESYVGDFNGDSKSDVLVWEDTPANNALYLSNGDGSFAESVSFNLKNIPLGHSNRTIGSVPIDFDGDGIPDILRWGDTVSNNSLFNNATELGDYLQVVTNGLGVTTTVTYKPLTDSSICAKDTTAVYPYVDIQAPMYVVSSVSVSDGTGGNAVTNYGYAGAKSHQLGGGFLGFRQVSAHDPQARIRSTTTYRQDYPYHGQPLTSQKLTDSNVLLSQNSITYTDQLLNTGLSPTWHQSLPIHTVESSYELNGGGLISTVITDTQYDPYGNPTSIVVNSGGGYSKTSTNFYDNLVDPDRWFLGRLRRSTVNSVTP